MTQLDCSQFPVFFGEAYGYEPFPWQRRLAERAVRGSWPEAIALPTASGKTSCLDIAVFALACQVGWPPADRTAPRRIFFVVDRRVIVEEAYERARKLAEKLRTARSGILSEVAGRLLKLAGDGGDPLACFQLRGGIYRDDAWARIPTQPTIVSSTVDQIGSRLLYRAYGVSAYSWPIHAGLAGNDSLIILDEAHCAQPFMQTLQAVAKYRLWADAPIDTPFHVVVMSATPPSSLKDTLLLDAADRQDPELGRRLTASKKAVIEVSHGPRESGVGERGTRIRIGEDSLVLNAVTHAWHFVAEGRQRIAVMVNRVATAKAVFDALRSDQLRPGCEFNARVELMTGRMRPADRDALLCRCEPILRASEPEPPATPVIVVTTQCLEVGADFSFDALITECASLDALRQRFGRLNRLGRDSKSAAVVLIRRDQTRTEEELRQLEETGKQADPIYGNSLAQTWNWLTQSANGPQCIDLGIDSVGRLLNKTGHDEILGLMAPAPDAPVMFPAHVDCWAQTHPEPWPSPDVTLFLHGPDRGSPEVQVCWRADLDPESEDAESWTEAVTLCPPSSVECMPVPLHVLRRWWQGAPDADAGLADVDGGFEDFGESEAPPGRVALRWLGPEDSELVHDAGRFRPGDTVVLPSSLGGWEIFGHIPDLTKSDPAVDIGDRSHLHSRRVAVLRIHPGASATWPACRAKTALLAVGSREESPEDSTELRELLVQLSGEEGCPRWLADAAVALARDRGLRIAKPYAEGLVLLGTRHLGLDGAGGDTYITEDDSASSTVSVKLDAHLDRMARVTADLAWHCCLSEPIIADLELAARLHDLGKADPRFQILLYGCVARGETLLAKSGKMRPLTPRQHQIIDRLGYPRGWRHELFSMQLAEVFPELLAQANDRELVLHLVASHHGRCRPFAPIVLDGDPPSLMVTCGDKRIALAREQRRELKHPHQLDSAVPERFWRLIRRYGWWGLAYLEAILRKADHRTSEVEQREHESKRPRKEELG